jgi:hypothetical protein
LQRKSLQTKKPGFPLQFLSLPAAGLRDFRCNPLRAQGRAAILRSKIVTSPPCAKNGKVRDFARQNRA